MTEQEKTKAELIAELQEIRLENISLKTLLKKNLSDNSQGENVVNEPDKLLHDVQKLAKIGLWEWDETTDIVVWSDELFKIAGLDSNFPAPSYAEHPKIYTPHSWDILQAAVENAINTGETYQLELELIRPDGTIRNVRAIGGARFSAGQDKITGLYGLVQDETDRKRTEMALRESEVNFEKVIGTMKESLSIINGDGDFIFANARAAFNLSGGKSNNIIGKNIRDFLPLEQANQLIEAYNKVIATQQSIKQEIEITLSGSNKWFLNTLQYIQYGLGKIPAVVSISLDITELKQAEQALKGNETRLKELNATKDKLFSIIAHDLRSPFNAIIGFSELLIENEFELADSKKYVGIINSSAKHTLILLDNLLNWAKSQTGQINFHPKKIILSSIIQEILEQMNSFATIKNITSIQEQSDDIEVYVDEDMLKTVLRNLISNAIKFTNSGGNISVFETINQNQVEITISDNGVGMNDETRKKLFNASTNKTSLGTANEKGSGLGLILCKEFVEKLGGNIWVESEVGKGSDFKFTLPLEKS